MNKGDNSSARATALQISLSIILMALSALLIATSFKGASSPLVRTDEKPAGASANSAPAIDSGQASPRRELSLSDRIGYQYAIEAVYWRHRIWPKENPAPKPSLDAVVSQRQIEQKVEETLRKSQLVVDRRGWPITGSELQAEMERMASQTKQPEILRELFAALDNDPVVIAECLVKPVLIERIVRECNGESNIPPVPGAMDSRTTYKLPEILASTCVNNSWTPTNFVDAPSGREWHTAVWTGTEMIVWGGADRNFSATNTGGRYNPALDSWLYTNPLNAPDIRSRHCAVWTGTEMIVWGGVGNNTIWNTGGRYNPVADTWTATSTANVPLARLNHTAVWTGTEMIVWGGYGCGGNCILNSGGRYNPANDSWMPTSTTNPPGGRWEHTAVWTGSEMIVWGGTNGMHYWQTGGRYNPQTDSWLPTTLTKAPLARIAHTAVWTGDQMIIWGGGGESITLFQTGSKYDPNTDRWTLTSPAPLARASHTAVWTGGEMIIWGGEGPASELNTGEHYNPATELWLPISTANAPVARGGHTAIWTGSQMIIWGGEAASTAVLYTGGSFCAQSGPTPTSTPSPTASSTPTATVTPTPHTPTPTPHPPTPTPGHTPTPTASPTPPCDMWTPTSTTLAPTTRSGHTAVWTGSEMIVWGGQAGSSYLDTGGRYNPSTDTWTPTSMILAPAARSGHTAIWTGSEMIVWGGDSNGFAFDRGARYNPTTDVWTNISIINVPTSRYDHTAVWTDNEMIVWGGQGDGFSVRTGGRYLPGIPDTWTQTTISGAPSPRDAHTAVWTGSEMIVWGGAGLTGYFNTGGRYNPSSDSWVATNLTGAPVARLGHSSVWTGSEMIVWGGTNSGPLNSGGKYIRGTDNWIATNITGAPSARSGHTAVWTGNEMIVWGGTNGTSLNSGGRYDPGSNSWTATSTTAAPSARDGHTAVWTGYEMIVWGGFDGSNYLRSGGKYCARSGPTPTPPPTTPTPTPCPVRAYIPNTCSGTVSVINTCNNTVVAQVESFGGSPSGVAVNSAGTRVYVTTDALSVIDTATNSVVAVIPVGSSPLGVAVKPDGTRVYVANQFSQQPSTLSVIDTSTNTVVGTVEVGLEPYGVAVSPDGTRVYVANFSPGTVSVIETSHNSVVATVQVQSAPTGIAVNPSGTRVYVANSFSHSLGVIDTSSNTMVATVSLGVAPSAVTVNPAGTRVYVTQGNNTVAVIDPSNNTVVATVPVGDNPAGVSVTPDGSRVYVANYQSKTVSVIDASSNTVVDTIGVGTCPEAFGNFIAVVPPTAPPPTPAPTPTPHACSLQVLIVYSDRLPPAEFQREIQDQPNVVAVDLFDAGSGTPTLAQLQQYDIIVPCDGFGSPFQDPDTLGDNLADYVDGGGVVVQYGFSYRGPAGGVAVLGRWLTGNYNPYYYSSDIILGPFNLGSFNDTHPLMAGVTALNSDYGNAVAPIGSTEVARTNHGDSLIAVRQANGGHTTVGVTAYVGEFAFQSGDWGKVVVNAGNWLYNCQPGGPTPTPGCGTWHLASSMPVDVYGAAGASDGTYFYAAGGYSWTQAPGSLNIFNRWSPDPSPNGSWVTLAPMPASAVTAMAVYYPPGNKIYVFGGSNLDTGETYNITLIYDIASNTWSTGMPMPAVRWGAAVGYIPATGLIYILSGSYSGPITAVAENTWAYDPVGDSWTDLTHSAPFPHPVSGPAYGVINNKLYIAGGADAIDGNNRTWEYDPVANIYTQKADEPSSLQNNVPGSAVASGRLWVFGGGNPFRPGNGGSTALPTKARSDAVQARGVKSPATPDTADDGRCYDPVTDTWTNAPNLVVARSFPSSGAIGDNLLIAAGGYNGSTSVHTVQKKLLCVSTPTPTPTPTVSPTPMTHAQNLSTRLLVGTGNNVAIGGFIITGAGPKYILLRGIGPSLGDAGVNALPDPVLELHGPAGFQTIINNNWMDDPVQKVLIIATGLPPSNNLESAIVTDLDPGAYTAILSGNGGPTGVGLVEIYDLTAGAAARLGNISTRGTVGTGNDIVIAGFILGGGTNDDLVILRGLGPSLPGGLGPLLTNPTLELRDGNGTQVAFNDNWMDDPMQPPIIIGAGLEPSSPLESCVAVSLSPGAYTALLAGKNGGTGLGLVEVYDNPAPAGATPTPAGINTKYQ